ncbi:methyltransferase [Eremomyces bilateralis CBS 781.70]|uniref:tRNA N(3)-methylcytidine methyltransferase n=1 Tax=Eremomyces bilateralis CBS 781.70 TaxID=1392243 RepID=A0A6G1GCS2_9PEZI|nr:methyltransferase [Eremomyces bilateralis CBS 781.70]KAF1815834.1 methyltransferase [Eremomyces bilateralis CBS 781.70]
MDEIREGEMAEAQSATQKRQQLSKGMEHLRSVVTVDDLAESAPNTVAETDKASTAFEPVRVLPHRSHDPGNNLKRSDPFQFGSRYLEQGDNIFEFNAWDHVETDDAYKEFMESQYAKQRESPVSEADKIKYNSAPETWWDKFYAVNTSNFFKNRNWLFQEFPVLKEVTQPTAGEKVLLEVGAGAGNTAYPILANNENPTLRIHACDFSKKAVEVIRSNEAYDGKMVRADVWDVAGTGDASLPPGIEAGTVDVILMIFIFSALSPDQWAQAVRNIWTLLKPGGEVFFRDYGRGDLAQVRFRKGRYMGENFYVRGDGTRVYFMAKEELESIWSGDEEFWSQNRQNWRKSQACQEDDGEKDISTEHGEEAKERSEKKDQETMEAMPKFDVLEVGVDNRMLVNRQRKLKMFRCWLQARFRKPKE